MENIFYVYVYLDPRKKGDFLYENFSFENEPFYVGKGCNNRYLEHLCPSKLKCKNFKNKKINKLISLGLNPIIKKIICDISEQDAFDIEKKLIKTIGRIPLKNGPLTNLTDGGEGFVGLVKTKIHRKRLSESLKGKKMSPETREKISRSLIGKPGRNTGKKHKEEVKLRISKSKKDNEASSWNAKAILQMTKNGEFIKEWISSHKAAKDLKLNQGNILSVIYGNRKTCGGFSWKLKD